jgi:hypothetical protein
MLPYPDHEQRLSALQEHLRDTQAITSDLIADVIAQACVRLPTHVTANARVNRLIDSGAFTDATLALIELELPQWKLRRLLYEDGAWHCSLSRQPQLPVGLDDTAEASHETLPLAILGALVEARRHCFGSRELRLRSVPQVRSTQPYAVCCDNFS